MRARMTVVAMVIGMASAGAQESGQGPWVVVDPEDRGGTRQVQQRAAGERSLTLTWPGTNTVVTLEGRAGRGAGFDLQAELGAKGVIQELLGEEAPEKTKLALRARPLPPDPETGAERLAVTYLVDGASWGAETWSRGGRPRLEIVSLTPAGAWDPKEGPLKVRYRVLGEQQMVRLRVLLPGGTASGSPRAAFYARQLGGAPRKHVALQDTELGWREPGTHEVELEGRDSTAARRILLAGEWTIRLDSGNQEERIAEETCQVVPPRVELVAPRWMQFDYDRIDKPGAKGRNPGSDRRGLAQSIATPLEALGASPSSQVEGADPAELLRALASSALVTIETHGYADGFALYQSTPEERAAVPVPELDPSRVMRFRAEDLERLAKDHGGDRPLRDLHTVIIYACKTGANGAEPGETMATESGTGLPSWLIRQGADIVVAFDRTVFTYAADLFLPRLFQDLSSRSSVQPKNGVRSLQWAAHEAASYAEKGFTRQLDRAYGPEFRQAFFAGGVARLEDCVRIFQATGVDADKETFDPPRYGNSRN